MQALPGISDIRSVLVSCGVGAVERRGYDVRLMAGSGQMPFCPESGNRPDKRHSD